MLTIKEHNNMKPGIYKNIDEVTYHALPYLGSSTLKRFCDNPLMSQQPFEPSATLQKSLDLGSAEHKLTLEGREAYEAEFVVAPPCNRTTKEGKAIWEEFKTTVGNRTILDTDQAEAVEGMNRSLRDHPCSSIMLNRGANELTCIWQDEATGLMMKARIDDYYNGVAMDLKTIADVSKFQWQIRDLHYDLQQAHYMEGLRQCGEEPTDFVFIAVQSTKTYPVRVGTLKAEKIAAAELEWVRLTGLYAQCQALGIWPNLSTNLIESIADISADTLLEEF